MKPFFLLGLCLLFVSGLYADLEDLIPEEKIDPESFAKAQDILKNYSIKRNLPRTQVKSTVAIYEYMLANLEFTSKIVQFLDLGKYTVEVPREGVFKVDDKNGVVAELQCIYRTEKMRVYLANGIFQAPFNLEIKSEGLIILKFVPAKGGMVDTKASLFFKVENKFLDKLSKSAHELVGLILEKKSTIFIYSAQTTAEYINENATQLYDEMGTSEVFTKEEIEGYYQSFLAPKKATSIPKK